MASLPAFRPAGLLIGLRRRFRTSEAALIVLALGIGLSTGLLTAGQSPISGASELGRALDPDATSIDLEIVRRGERQQVMLKS